MSNSYHYLYPDAGRVAPIRGSVSSQRLTDRANLNPKLQLVYELTGKQADKTTRKPVNQKHI